CIYTFLTNSPYPFIGEPQALDQVIQRICVESDLVNPKEKIICTIVFQRGCWPLQPLSQSAFTLLRLLPPTTSVIDLLPWARQIPKLSGLPNQIFFPRNSLKPLSRKARMYWRTLPLSPATTAMTTTVP